MLHTESVGLLVGAVALGAVHGLEPGHGWPIAASYALDRTNKWLYGLLASTIIGVGHLVSSIAMVGVFFYAKAYFDLTQLNEPITVFGETQIGGPISLTAGLLLVGLGVREYVHGHSHAGYHGEQGHSHDHDHANHDDHDHDHANHDDHGHDRANHDDHDHDRANHVHDNHGHARTAHSSGRFAQLTTFLPFLGGHTHAHVQTSSGAEADRGLLGIAWFAFVLGFAHEEEFEIIALCAGSSHCLALMTAYALTVIAGIVCFTMVLIAGYQHFEDEVERYTPYLPAVSAAVLVGMGVGFISGLF